VSDRRLSFTGPPDLKRRAAPAVQTHGVGAMAALIIAITLIIVAWKCLFVFRRSLHGDAHNGVVSAVTLVLMVAVAGLLVPAILALVRAAEARRALSSGDVINARIIGDKASTWVQYTIGIGVTVAVLSFLFLFLGANSGGVRRPFLSFGLMGEKFATVLRAFRENVIIFLITELFVLVWGLIVAIARLTPGKPGRPVRLLATAYIDLFRGIPAVIIIYLLGFGLRKAGLPIVKDFSDRQYAIFSLTLTYGAYVAEVYRAGIESIHWSQTAAARSLGLSYSKSLRYVIVPQAVRRIVPPLLNDFIGLQKDTSLVGFIGVIEAFNQARIINSQNANLSALTIVAALFYVITVPQGRLVDYLIRRDQARMRAGG